MSTRALALRLAASLAALGAGAAAIVIVVTLLRSEPGPLSTATVAGGGGTPVAAPTQIAGGRIATPNQPGFPSPPPGALVFAQEAGANALGFAVVPGSPRSLVRVSVLSAAGPGATGLRLSVAFGSTAVRLRPCGAGCYQNEIAIGAARLATVRLGTHAYVFKLPASLQPPDATALVSHATAVWRSLKTLVWHERLAGSPTDVIHTVYVAVAPDELSYTITGLSAAIIIGGTRWDRDSPKGRWVRSIQDPALQVPVPFWYAVSDARLLGTSSVGGRAVWTVSFFDPTTPAWFTAEIDKRSGRTLELWMTAASHFMHHLYGPFNAPLSLHPPAGAP